MIHFLQSICWNIVSYVMRLLVFNVKIIGWIFVGRLRLRTKSFPLDNTHNILVLRLDEIGDFVIFTPVLKMLRMHLPHAYIKLVVNPQVYNLAEACPYVNEVSVFSIRNNSVFNMLTLPFRACLYGLRLSQKTAFDMSISARWATDACYAAFIAYFAGAAYRIGYSESVDQRKSRLNAGFDSLLTKIVFDKSIRHESEHNTILLSELGWDGQADYPEIWLTDEDMDYANRVFADFDLKRMSSIVVLCPSYGHSILKQWPLENFSELTNLILNDDNSRVIVVGGRDDMDMGGYLLEKGGSRVINLTGKTTLRQMAAIIKLSTVYVGNDTGPTHIASAVGIPVVALFGPSCIHRYSPRGENCTVASMDMECSVCNAGQHKLDRCKKCIYEKTRCMHGLTVNAIYEKVANYLLFERGPVQNSHYRGIPVTITSEIHMS